MSMREIEFFLIGMGGMSLVYTIAWMAANWSDRPDWLFKKNPKPKSEDSNYRIWP